MTKIPIFATHYSLGSSILTNDEPYTRDIEELKSKPLPPEQPLSVFDIQLKHNLPEIFVADDSIAGFWKLYKNSHDLGLTAYFGLKICVCQNNKDKTPESRETESNVIIWFRNSQAYYDIIKLYSEASVDGFYYRRRTDWKTIQQYWTDNFILAFPFYSNPIVKNSMYYGSRCVPELGDIKPVINLEEHGLPFDSLIRRRMEKWNSEYNFETMETHTCYYYRTADAPAAMTLKNIVEGGNWENPNLNFFNSPYFSYESLVGENL